MKSQDFLSRTQKIFNTPFDRAMKLGTVLRKHGFYPDGRAGGIDAHVTATQAAHLVRMLALNPTPGSSDIDNYVMGYMELWDRQDRNFIDELADLLKDNGEAIAVGNVVRVSLSLDRNFATIITKPPLFEQLLTRTESAAEHYVTKEGEITFGRHERRTFERWAIIKKSALRKIALALSNTGLDTPADEILLHINESKK